jgi:lichenan operon transcriptional antiterminator
LDKNSCIRSDNLREKIIIQELYGMGLVSSKKMSYRLGVSERTIRNDIKDLNTVSHKNGFTISNKRGDGYYLTVFDEKLFKLYLDKIGDNFYNDNPVERVNKIIYILLVSRDYLTIDKIAEIIEVSRSTIIRDLELVEENIERMDLTLNKKTYYGLTIQGTEDSYRKALTAYYKFIICSITGSTDIQQFVQLLDITNVDEILYEELKEHKVNISEVSLRNIAIHLKIMLYRVKNGHYLCKENKVLDEDEFFQCKKVAKHICNRFEEIVCITIPEGEVNYLASHILSKSSYVSLNGSFKDGLKTKIKEYLEKIDQIYLSSFSQDEELLSALLLHIYPLLNRLYNDLELKNPLLDEVSSRYADTLDIAIKFSEMIMQDYGFRLSSDETGYIALHFAVYVERRKKKRLSQFKRIAVLCTSGGGASYLLKLSLESVFYNADIYTYSVLEIDHLHDGNFDLILTILPLTNQQFQCPVIRIREFLDKKELNRIQDIIELGINKSEVSYTTRFYVLQELFSAELFDTHCKEHDYKKLLISKCESMIRTEKVGANFTELVLERERLFSTAYKNLIAAPHPIEMNAVENSVAVTILDSPIDWNGKPVQIIFLVALKRGELSIHKEISSLVLRIMESDDLRKRITSCKTFDGFIREISMLD